MPPAFFHPGVEAPFQHNQNPAQVAIMQRGEDLQAALARQNLARHLLRQNRQGENRFEPDDVNRVVEQALSRIGFNIGAANQPNFASAFPEWVQLAEIPRGTKVPKLSKFSGEAGESTVEHVARYTIEMGELAADEALKMRLFPSSLTRNAFSWFSTLRPHSIHAWAQLERAFHEQFYRGELKVALTDLLNVKRLAGEPIDDYLARFRQMRSRCFTPIPEPEVVKMAVTGLEYHIRKKLVTQHLLDLAQLAACVRQIENLRDEKYKSRNPTRFLKREKVNYVDSSTPDMDDDDCVEVDNISLEEGKPYVCQALRPSKPTNENTYKKVYTFDVSRTEQVFDMLVRDKLIRLPEGHKLVKKEDLRGRKYCKYHNNFSHSTNDCFAFRNLVQQGLDKGRLKYLERDLKVDTDPFQREINEVDEEGTFPVSMVNLAYDEEVFPAAGESFRNFCQRKHFADLRICPRCQVIYDEHATIAKKKALKKEDLRNKLKQRRLLPRKQQQEPPVPKKRPFSQNTSVKPKTRRLADTVRYPQPTEVRKRLAPRPKPSIKSLYEGLTKTQKRRAQRNRRQEASRRVELKELPSEGQGCLVAKIKPNMKRPSKKTQPKMKKQWVRKNTTSKEAEGDTHSVDSMEIIVTDQDMVDAQSKRITRMSINNIGLPPDFEGRYEVDVEDDDSDGSYLSDEIPDLPECLFLLDRVHLEMDISRIAQFEPLEESKREHLKPLHIKAIIDGKPLNRVLVDGGAAVNILPWNVFKRMGKQETDLVPTNIVVVGFTGKSAQSHGVVMLKVEVGSNIRDTLFVVVPTKASYNLLLGRDWIHAVGVVPSTAHQKLILWNQENKVEVIQADDSPCYMQQMHVDFKVYSPNIKPIRLDAEHFQRSIVEKCLVESYGVSLSDEAVEQRSSPSRHD